MCNNTLSLQYMFIHVTQRKVQDMRESDVDAAGPVVRRTRQNLIIKVRFDLYSHVRTLYTYLGNCSCENDSHE